MKTRLFSLKGFYLTVQVVMLLVSVPKVAALFGAYDQQSTGLTFMGLDIRDWLVGIAIDATVAITSWAAMVRYEATRHRRDLTPSVIIVLFCAAISVLANYEDAAAMRPAQYTHLVIIHWSAILVNAIVVASPPVIVVVLQCLVPSVLAQPRVKTAAEIAAETAERVAKLRAEAQIKSAQAEANSAVRSAQLAGLARTAATAKDAGAYVFKGRKDALSVSDSDSDTNRTPDDDPNGPDDGPGNGPGSGARSGSHRSVTTDASAMRVRALSPLTPYTDRSLLSEASAAKRVRKTQVVRTSDLAELLGVSDSRALDILRHVPSVERDGAHTQAAYVAPLAAVKAHLKAHHPAHYRAFVRAIPSGGRTARGSQSHPHSDAYPSAYPSAGSIRTLDRTSDRTQARTSAVVATAGRSAPIAVLHPQSAAYSEASEAEA